MEELNLMIKAQKMGRKKITLAAKATVPCSEKPASQPPLCFALLCILSITARDAET